MLRNANLFSDPLREPAIAVPTERLTCWGFNALGAWLTPQFWTDVPKALPFTMDVEQSRLATPDAVLGPWASGMPDVFSPA